MRHHERPEASDMDSHDNRKVKRHPPGSPVFMPARKAGKNGRNALRLTLVPAVADAIETLLPRRRD